MMKIFEFSDYKEFVKKMILLRPNGGRGEYRKLAEHLYMHTTLISQIFNGDRDLSGEQGCALAEYFGLSELETEYLISLIELSRAGSARLKKFYQDRINALRERGLQVEARLPPSKVLSDEQRGIFYSQWYYSAIRLICSITGFQRPELIAETLGVKLSRTREVLSFLVSANLCKEVGGNYTLTEARTHTSRSSSFAGRHHANWRLQAIEKFEIMRVEDIAFTAPLTISRAGAEKIRSQLMAMIEQVSQTVSSSDSEELYCLNLDWFRVNGANE